MPFSVGKSSYPDLRGVTQFVASAVVAAQVASLCYEFDTQVAKGGDRLTVNEGIRSRARQDKLFNDYLYHGGALAANPYTSTHDHTRGSALDFGITRPDGSNRALTTAEFNWLHARAPLRGIRWTGAGFSRVEPWHHNGGYASSLPPITGVNEPGEPIANLGDKQPKPPVAPEPDDESDDTVKITWDAEGKQPTLWVGKESWPMTNLTVAAARIQLPQTLALIRRLIRADQNKDYPEKFNALEQAIIKTALKQVK